MKDKREVYIDYGYALVDRLLDREICESGGGRGGRDDGPEPPGGSEDLEASWRRVLAKIKTGTHVPPREGSGKEDKPVKRPQISAPMEGSSPNNDPDGGTAFRSPVVPALPRVPQLPAVPVMLPSVRLHLFNAGE